MIILKVVQGEGRGRRVRFDAETIKLGRNVENDFTVRDQFVSKWHGEIVRQPHGYLYRDLSSRHGTIVSFLDQIVRLRKGGEGLSCYLSHGSRIQIGQTVIELSIDVLDSQLELQNLTDASLWSDGAVLDEDKGNGVRLLTPPGADSELWLDGFDETGDIKPDHPPTPPKPVLVPALDARGNPEDTPSDLSLGIGRKRSTRRTARMPVPDSDIFHATKTLVLPPADLLRRNFARKDPRLQILMRLSGQLNGLSRLSDIIDLIVSTTFTAFPLTHCFSIRLFDASETLVSFVTRFNADDEVLEAAQVLCAAHVRRVAESSEAYLFRRAELKENELADEDGFLDGPTQSAIYVPLMGQRNLLGVFSISSKNAEKPFSVQDLELFSVLASNVAFSLERAKLTENIFSMFEGFVKASVVAIEARDPTTAGHSERVAGYTIALAEGVNQVEAGELGALRFSPNELTELRYAALLHDFGKVGVREQVLNKATRLSEQRMKCIRYRFAMLKEKHRRWQLDALVRELSPQGRVPSGEELLDLDKEHALIAERLDRIVDFLEAIRRVNFIDEAMASKLRALRNAHIRFGMEGEHQLLEPDEIQDLSVPRGNLNEEEWDDMRSHARKTELFLQQIPWSRELNRVPCIAGAHHEKLDGSGYPSGLSGNQILPQVRIMTIADIFDAVTANDRPYRRAASIPKALGILAKEADAGKLDKRLVALFAERVLPRVAYLIPKKHGV